VRVARCVKVTSRGDGTEAHRVQPPPTAQSSVKRAQEEEHLLHKLKKIKPHPGTTLSHDAGNVLLPRDAHATVEVPRASEQNGRGSDVSVERKHNGVRPIFADELRQDVIHRVDELPEKKPSGVRVIRV